MFFGIGFVRSKNEKLSDTWPIFVMGTLRNIHLSIVFIPGGYFTFVFIMILCRVDGFGYEMLPEDN